jgi:hypothetical protein
MGEDMSSDWGSVQRPIRKISVPGALVALLGAAMAFSTAGCFLPVLSIIPSVISLAHAAYSAGSGTDNDTDPRVKDAEASAAEPSKPAPKLTNENMCQMMAIARPDMVLVELRKNSSGAPEYRELRLLNSTDEAHWSPVADSETGPSGWIPAVNFLKMDFNPSLTNLIPDAGTCYLAYVPSSVDPSDPSQVEQIRSTLGGTGTFSWAGRVYVYTVARTAPCLAPSS